MKRVTALAVPVGRFLLSSAERATQTSAKIRIWTVGEAATVGLAGESVESSPTLVQNRCKLA